MIRRPPRSTQSRSSAASDVYKRQGPERARRTSGEVLGGGGVASDCPQHVAADDGGELDRPYEAGREPGAVRCEERQAAKVPALQERVAQRDEDLLAVDEEECEVVAGDVAGRDRHEAGADGGDADRRPR